MNRVTDEEYREKMAEMDQQNEELKKQFEKRAEELKLAEEQKQALKKIVDADIREAHKRQFPMSPELETMKKKYPNAVFIQVLGSSGTGKSTLMNTLVDGVEAVDEDDYKEIFKTDVVECTTVSQFYDVTEKMKKKLNNNQFAWLKQSEKYGGGQFPN